MYYDSKAISKYLRRRHKLFRSIKNYIFGIQKKSKNKLPNQLIKDESQQKQIQKNIQVNQNTNYKVIEQNDKLQNYEEIVQNNEQDYNKFETNLINQEDQSLINYFSKFFTIFLQENYNIEHALYLMNKSLKSIKRLIDQFIENIIIVSKFSSGHKLAYLLYRFCKQNPETFKQINHKLICQLKKIVQKQTLQYRQTIFYTDLYFYGFNISCKLFYNIFIHSQRFILDYVINLPSFMQWYQFVPKRFLYKIRISSENWINQEIKNTKSKFNELEYLQQIIQKNQVQRKRKQNLNNNFNNENDIKQNKQQSQIQQRYNNILIQYQTNRQKLQYLQRDQNLIKAKQIKQLTSQCQHYQPQFCLPQLLHKLYIQRQLNKITIPLTKRSQTASIYQDQAFLLQLRNCPSINTAVDLSSYFISQLNNSSNKQLLIQYIIDDCHNDLNIDLIMKIVAEINSHDEDQEISKYLTKKAIKITSQIKINKKYINLICQGIKYKMIPSKIMLDYLQKRLTTDHSQFSQTQTVKQCCSILQLLGQSIYHQSLKTNIRINYLISIIQIKINRNKLGAQSLFILKCLKSYLNSDYSNNSSLNNGNQKQSTSTLTQLLDLNLKQHFNLILLRITQLISKSNNNKTQEIYNRIKVKNYIINSIQTNNFIQTFYQASLLKQINDKQLRQEFNIITIDKIQDNIVKENAQKSVLWSRFLGELYNYQLIGRKKLVQIIQLKILYFLGSNLHNFQQIIACILQCLQTSKNYILQSQLSRQENQYLICLLIKLKRSILQYLNAKQNKLFNNVMIEQFIQQTFLFFHPALLQKLNKIQQIDIFVQRVKFSSQNSDLQSFNMYKMLSYYQKAQNVTQFDPIIIFGQKKNNNNNKNNKNKNKNKKLVYKQKNSHQEDIKQKINFTLKQKSKQLIKQQSKYIELPRRQKQNNQIEILQKQIIKKQSQIVSQQLIEMMGFHPQILDQSSFPSLNQMTNSNYLQNKKTQENMSVGNNIQDIKKKKIKVLSRKNINLKGKKYQNSSCD